MTTVGYGNYTPQTQEGRVFTSAFALFSVGNFGLLVRPPRAHARARV